MPTKSKFLILLSSSALLLTGCGGDNSSGSTITKDKALTILNSIKTTMSPKDYLGPTAYVQNGKSEILDSSKKKTNVTTESCIDRTNLYSYTFITTDTGGYSKTWNYWDNDNAYEATYSNLNLTTLEVSSTVTATYTKTDDPKKAINGIAIALQAALFVETVKGVVDKTIADVNSTTFDTKEYFSKGDNNLTFNQYQTSDGEKIETYERHFDNSLLTKTYDIGVNGGSTVIATVDYSYTTKALVKPDLTKMTELVSPR